ncbi:alpha,alpha-trehalase TreA [Mucilaginibacter daejeonensis]|uniref:alpha,alpha-trehalase TreA n=1 Tax=Mucilaginibacter daejeonensis TaxID=398049 RepID=UPI001D17BEFC|nr:alpha,alpha-trehalase TreA [Mucilaginibacter daejeonensis]UEG53536.1 alpha,alpha-trehalase TreA [Mucilaginibacter daejeonensis]
MPNIKIYFLTVCSLLLGGTITAQPKSPAQLYPGLFEAVQMNQVYADGKTFVDATPRRPAAAINKQYQEQRSQPGFDLRKFVKANFAAPEVDSGVFKSNISAGIRKHIDTLWTVLKHVADTAKGTSLIPLPYDYVVPGGRFREVYYWDSYFTMLGLEESKRYDLIESMVKNFAYLIDHYGHIPNGNRTYYLSRSQPPFFSLMVELLAKSKGKKVLATYRPQLIKEYNYWMKGGDALKAGTATAHVVRMADGSLLNRYWDASDKPREESYREDVLAAKQSKQQTAQFYRNIRAAAESGWDFSSRWFSDGKSLPTIQTTDLVAVDLNSLLYHLEQVIARSYEQSGDAKTAALYCTKAAKRKAALIKYCWDGKQGLFYDHNWRTGKLSTQMTIATAFPLFFNIASAQQAKSVAAVIKSKFVQPGGVATTLIGTGQQWDQPNGWAPLQYITVAGLRNYQQNDLAKSLALRWMALNITTFKKTGKLSEKYDVQHTASKAGGGEYPLQDGFGWTNGVLLKLMNMYAEPEF